MKEEDILKEFVQLGMKVFFHGVDAMLHNPQTSRSRPKFNYSLNCQGIGSHHHWSDGKTFYKYLLNTETKIDKGGDLAKIFDADGFLRETELKVMNLKPSGCKSNPRKTGAFNSSKCWEEVGSWNTWNGLDIKDIVWPGGSHVPPQGVPEKFHIKITYLEEPPFIIVSDPDPVSSKCSMNRGVPCRFG